MRSFVFKTVTAFAIVIGIAAGSMGQAAAAIGVNDYLKQQVQNGALAEVIHDTFEPSITRTLGIAVDWDQAGSADVIDYWQQRVALYTKDTQLAPIVDLAINAEWHYLKSQGVDPNSPSSIQIQLEAAGAAIIGFVNATDYIVGPNEFGAIEVNLIRPSVQGMEHMTADMAVAQFRTGLSGGFFQPV
jgi:hypothetical protein